MRTRSLRLVVLLGMGLAGSRADADPVYSVTDLGQADMGSNYLEALSAGDQATFRAGSFERFSHPVPSGLPRDWIQGDVDRSTYDRGLVYDHVTFASGNNQGDVVGVSSETIPSNGSGAFGRVALFRPDPHTLHVAGSPSDSAGVPSPGYLDVPSWPSPLSGYFGSVSGINDHKLVVGSNQRYPNWQETAPVLIDVSAGMASPVELGSLGGKNGVGNALNNAGRVVGWSELADGAHHAFVYDKGIMEDLNTLIPPTSGLTFSDAVGIDGTGRIVAFATDGSGVSHEYLLTPTTVPEPSVLALFGLVAGGLALQHDRRRRRLSRAA